MTATVDTWELRIRFISDPCSNTLAIIDCLADPFPFFGVPMKSARRVFVVSGVLAYIASEGTPAITQNAASIGTDRPTYVAGEPVTITGRDFAAGEIVTGADTTPGGA